MARPKAARRDRPAAKRAARAASVPVAVAPQPRLPAPRWWIVVALIVATVLAYLPGISAPFAFDDIGAIPQNPSIERLWPPSTALHPPANLPVTGRPVVNYSLALNTAINRDLGVAQPAKGQAPHETVGYHIFNLIIHICAGLLLLGVIRRTFARGRIPESWVAAGEWIAPTVAALWLLHPIQTDAVDYVIQRTELLVSLFYLAALYASIRAWDATTTRRRLAWLAAAVVACALGMASKEVMITAPLVIALYDRAFRATSWRAAFARGRAWFYGAMVAVVAVVYLGIARGARGTSAGLESGVTWYRYFYSQAWAVAHYVRLIVWPNALNFDYGQHVIGGWLPAVDGVLLAAAFVAVIALWRRWPWLGFTGVSFFILLAPSSSVVPVATEIAAERRVYLASAAVFVLVVVGADWLRRRVMTQSRAESPIGSRRVWLGALAVVCVVLGVITARRSALYENPEALWTDAAARTPGNPRAYEHLGALALDRGQPAQAAALFQKSIATDSTYLSAWTNLADVDMQQGRDSTALGLLQHVLRIGPDYVDASRRLGELLVKLGQPARAIPYLERVTASYPSDDALVTLASAYMAVGRPDDAANALRRAVALAPYRADALSYLGGLLAQQGRTEEAIDMLARAVSTGQASGSSYGVLSLAYAQTGQLDQAVAVAAAGTSRAGSDPAALMLLGRAMLLAQHFPEAEQDFTAASRLAPTDPEPVTRLGIAKAAQGDGAAAATLFRRALTLQPGYPPAEAALRKLGGG